MSVEVEVIGCTMLGPSELVNEGYIAVSPKRKIKDIPGMNTYEDPCYIRKHGFYKKALRITSNTFDLPKTQGSLASLLKQITKCTGKIVFVRPITRLKAKKTIHSYPLPLP